MAAKNKVKKFVMKVFEKSDFWIFFYFLFQKIHNF